MRIIEGLSPAREALARKIPFQQIGVEEAVRQIIDDVRHSGDKAIREYTSKFDGVALDKLEVPRSAIKDATKRVQPELLAALKLAAGRIKAFHEAQKEHLYQQFSLSGTAQVARPLERVGVYVPGGSASYPSTVLMTAVIARVAGVKESIMVTPPGKDGNIPGPTLAAAGIAGVDRVFRIGGSQAIAALAFGTESVPRVDKICGPGNIYVVMAKKLVYGVVDIDGLQGPSEVLIISDEKARPDWCAADLLAQAEHDAMAGVVMVTTSRLMAERTNEEISRQIESLPRRDTINKAMEEQGIIAVVRDLDEAVFLANEYAPEHLIIMVEKAEKYLKKIKNAGCIFTGVQATVPIGDYVAGPSHVLPTGGSARFSSPLNLLDFMKFTSVVKGDEIQFKELGASALIMARAEGLEAHARAVEKRLGMR